MALDPTEQDEFDPYVAWARAQPQQVTATEYPLAPVGALPPPQVPPPPPPPQTIGPTGAPVQDEVPAGAFQQAPRLSPAEEEQIEIDQPPSPGEENAEGEALPVDVVSAAAPIPLATTVSYEQAPAAQPPGDAYAASFQSPEERDAYLEHQQQQLGEQPLPSLQEKEQAQQDRNEQTAIAGMTPDEYVQYKARREAILLSKQVEATAAAQLENERRMHEDLAMHQAANAKTAAEMKDVTTQAQQLANTKINPDRYVEKRGLIRTLGDVFGMMALGLGGRPDIAIQMFDSSVNRDIAAQTSDIQNQFQALGIKRGAIADEYARHGDLYRAQETYRVAAYQSAINKIQTQLQQYDPAGATAIRARDALGQFHAAQGQALQALQQTQFKNNLDLAKEQREGAKAYAEIAKMKAETAKIQGVGGGGGQAAKPVKFEDQPLSLEQLRGMGIAIPQGVALPAGVAGISVNQARKLTEAGASGEEWAAKARANAPATIAQQLGVGELVDTTGKPLHFRSPESAEKIQSLKASADLSVQLIDRIKNAYKMYGWSSDLLKSPEWQQAQSDYNQLIVEQKNVDQLGALSSDDMKLVTRALGGADPTGFRDPTPGLERARVNVVEKLNANVRAASLTPPKRWDPPLPQPQAPTTPEEEQVKDVIKFEPRANFVPTLSEVRGAAPKNTEVLPPQISSRIDRLIAVSNNPNASDQERAQAAAFLKTIIEESHSSIVRNYATKAAAAGATEAIKGSPEEAR